MAKKRLLKKRRGQWKTVLRLPDPDQARSAISGLPSKSTGSIATEKSPLPSGQILPSGKLNSTLTVVTTTSTAIGKSTATITGTISGALVRTVTVPITVTPLPLAVSNSCPTSVTLGNSFTDIITASVNG